MTKPTVEPYLFFGGRCEEALEFYKKAMGAEIKMIMRFKESPEPVSADMIPPGFDDKIMHAAFKIGDTNIMASDGCQQSVNFTGFSLALSFSTQEEVNRVFEHLADGGVIQMPLAKTFWSPLYGAVTDRFGVGWMVMVTPDKT